MVFLGGWVEFNGRMVFNEKGFIGLISFWLLAVTGLAAGPTAHDLAKAGLTALEKGDWDKAAGCFDQGITLLPKDPWCYAGRGIVEHRNWDLANALADYNQCIALGGNLPEWYVIRGDIKRDMDDMEGAMADYNKALEINPKIIQACWGIAAVKRKEGDLGGAVAELTQGIAQDSRNAKSFAKRGDVKREEDDLTGALADYNHSIFLDPNYAEAYAERGAAERAMGNIAGAMEDFKQAIALDPKLAYPYKARATTEAVNERWKDALGDYQKSCELAPTYQDYCRLYIYLIKARLGEAGEAGKELADYFKKRKVVRPGDWTGTIGGYLLGSVSESELFACASGANAWKLKGETCEAWYYAGMKRLLGGDKKGAAEYFRNCVATKMDDYVEFELAHAELKALGG